MVEAQYVRVERQPVEWIRPAAVCGVAGDRMPEPREVDADLVPSPRFEPHLEQRVARDRAQHAPVRDRRSPVSRTGPGASSRSRLATVPAGRVSLPSTTARYIRSTVCAANCAWSIRFATGDAAKTSSRSEEH